MNLLSLLLGSMTEENSVGTIAGKTGLTSKQITKLLLIAIPLLLKAMTNNASSQTGAQSLLGALMQHSSKKSMAEQFAEADQEDGAKIIGHILGSNTAAVNDMEKETGLNAAQIAQVLSIIAPSMLNGVSAAVDSAKEESGPAAKPDADAFDGTALLGALLKLGK